MPLLLSLFLLLSSPVANEEREDSVGNQTSAEQILTWDDFVQTLSWDEETMDEEQWTQYVQSLEYLHFHPMNINTATAEEMAQIPFITPSQIEDIQGYVSMDGEMKTLGELHLIPSIDNQTRLILPLFFVAEHVDRADSRKWFGNMKNSADSRIDVPLYYRDGFLRDNGYQGDVLYNRIRYNLESNNVLIGLNVEKDAGERFYDSYGGYAMIRERGILRQALLGDYRAGWGEGLVMSERSSGSKSTMMYGTGRGIRPMTGTDETNFLRGAAVTLGTAGEQKNTGNAGAGNTGAGKSFLWQGTLFGSVRQRDATLNDDGNVQTLLSTGLHRTASEIEKKNNTLEVLLGGHFGVMIKHVTIGATGYWQHYDRSLEPGTQTYRRYYPQGKDFGVIGVHAGYSYYRWNASGEVAYSTEKNGVAALARAQYLAYRWLKIAAMGRYYSHKYYSTYSAAIGENSSNQNETGAMLRFDLNPWRGWSFSSYIDFFSDYWPRYLMTHSSQGQEFQLEANYSMTTRKNSSHMFSLRYQMKRKEASDVMVPHHRLRGQWTFSPSSVWRLQTTAGLHIVEEQQKTCAGWSVSEIVKGSFMKEALKASVMVGYFDTPDYLSRIYIYEPTLWSSTSNGSCYGQGIRGACTLRYTFPHGHWMVEGKYRFTHMMDRDRISSGYQTIYSSTYHELSFQVRVIY